MSAARSHPRRVGAIRWGAILFLIGFAVLLLAIISYCLIPGMKAALHATDEEKRHLVAWYRLLLAVVLLILFSGLVLTFRVGRFFLPRPTPAPTRTEYVDAWAESAKRMKVISEDPGNPAADGDESDHPDDGDDAAEG
jgi:hypothetical protein